MMRPHAERWQLVLTTFVPCDYPTSMFGDGRYQAELRNEPMREIKACGVLVLRGEPVDSFLLMKHRDRWDLPKGHVDDGETDIACALRELQEETGIAAGDIELDPDFCFTTIYDVQSKRFGEACRKALIVFLARLRRDVPIVLSEHPGYQWFSWSPPHRIQAQTIDPLLAAVERHLK